MLLYQKPALIISFGSFVFNIYMINTSAFQGISTVTHQFCHCGSLEWHVEAHLSSVFEWNDIHLSSGVKFELNFCGTFFVPYSDWHKQFASCFCPFISPI